MKPENQNLDNRLTQLKSELSKLQQEINEIENKKAQFDQYKHKRKEALLANSVKLESASLEVYDNMYFLIFKDDTFEYVARLTSEQAAYLADDLDHELGKAHIDQIFKKEMLNNMLNPIFKNMPK
jgi:hypothetical protein